jgi:hypothetical protein
MYPNVPQFNMNSPQTGYPYVPMAPASNMAMPGFQNQAFQSPVDSYSSGYAAPEAAFPPSSIGMTYPRQNFNMNQNNAPAVSANIPPQRAASAPSDGGIGAGGAPGEPSEAELEAILSQLQALSGPGGGGGLGGPQPGSGMPLGADPRGVSGHTTSGSIVVQPDGQFWDMSNPSSGGFLSKLTPKNLLKLAVAGGAAWLSWYFLFQRGAAKALQTETKQFQDFLGNHAQRLSELTEAIQSKSKEKITELGKQVKEELAGILNPFKENLAGEDAKHNLVKAAKDRHQELYEAAAKVSENNVSETLGKVNRKAEEAEKALKEVKTGIIDPEGG